jgi:hypothetical protein
MYQHYVRWTVSSAVLPPRQRPLAVAGRLGQRTPHTHTCACPIPVFTLWACAERGTPRRTSISAAQTCSANPNPSPCSRVPPARVRCVRGGFTMRHAPFPVRACASARENVLFSRCARSHDSVRVRKEVISALSSYLVVHHPPIWTRCDSPRPKLFKEDVGRLLLFGAHARAVTARSADAGLSSSTTHGHWDRRAASERGGLSLACLSGYYTLPAS